jgi:hypothetical protein
MAIHQLTEDDIKTRKDGRYEDGGGLWLVVRSKGSAASYFFEYNGKLVDEKGWGHVSLGSRKKNLLSTARERAELCRQLLKRNISPKHWPEHERKEARNREGATLTVAEAIEGRDYPKFEGFRTWATGRIWRKKNSLDAKRGIIDNYFKPSAIWNMPVQAVEVEHACKILDPIWFPKPAMGKRVQSFGVSLFRWLKLRKLYSSDNPFGGHRYGELVGMLGGPQPPGGHFKDPEPDDLPLVMAHLRTPPTHGDDVCTVAELAEASERSTATILHAIHAEPPILPGAYRWAPWGTAPYLIPLKALEKSPAREMFALKRPLRKHIEVSIEDLAVQYVILTAVRSDMACQLRKEWINEKRGVIEYPKYDHKTGEKLNDIYTVIITDYVAEILEDARAYQERHRIKSDYVFIKGPTRTGIDFWKDEQVKKAALWRNFKTLLARIPGIEKPNATLVGVRTTFITQMVDREERDKSVADAILGHTIKGISNKSYFRNVRHFRQSQEIMSAWGKFLLQIQPDSVDAIPWRSQSSLRNEEGKLVRPWQPHIVP